VTESCGDFEKRSGISAKIVIALNIAIEAFLDINSRSFITEPPPYIS
jgi:hypothetical protein